MVYREICLVYQENSPVYRKIFLTVPENSITGYINLLVYREDFLVCQENFSVYQGNFLVYQENFTNGCKIFITGYKTVTVRYADSANARPAASGYRRRSIYKCASGW